MTNINKILSGLFLAVCFSFGSIYSQSLKELGIKTSHGLGINSYSINGTQEEFSALLPLFTIEINDTLTSSLNSAAREDGDEYILKFTSGLTGRFSVEKNFSPGWKGHLVLENNSDSTIKILNLVPLGQSPEHIYITASAPWNLASSKIFRPGLGSIGVVLPDNAWELGYSAIGIGNDSSIAALARRTGGKKTDFHRYSALIKPGGKVEYDFYADIYQGQWQNGLRMMFHDRYLYDLKHFDNKLFERKDLDWIRQSYVVTVQYAWDHNYYDMKDKKYNFSEFLEQGKKMFGGYDVFCIWPTWPTLGLDERNQWELYNDLPGGLKKMHQLSEYAKAHGTKFFISFNPWDKSTHKENFYTGISRMIKATDADGVVLDTYGSSSERLQNAADSIRPGVIMYSEGMAVPKDMPGIVAGRVHDAIYMPPPLNLNKFIKPQFAIFRVDQLSQGMIHREIAIAFFNGYGTEVNTMAPGRPDWMHEEYLYLGKTTMLLRENSSNFLSQNWTPLLPTLIDSVWVNEWPGESKTVYTVFSLRPEGYNGAILEASVVPNRHFVDLWHHEEIKPVTINGKSYLPVSVHAFNRSWLGTRNEGNVDCIASLPELLKVKLNDDSLEFSAVKGDSILVWADNPSYQSTSKKYETGMNKIKLMDVFGRYNGKFVVQLFGKGVLLDEKVIEQDPGTARLISKVASTPKTDKALAGMVEIPGGEYVYRVEKEDEFIPYPKTPDSVVVHMHKFYMDKYPVTNEQFKKFIDATNYKPQADHNYLKNWKNGTYPKGKENYPVVYVSRKDAEDYAKWAGKRLPTEMEWQYAGQGADTLSWPWGHTFNSKMCNNSSGHLTAVDAFPKGKSKFGVTDMIGNVWQITNDVYDDCSYYIEIIRGGCYYNPTASWWYVKGGPQPLNHRQVLLMVSPGFDRNATVGFRCVKDTE
ncbi:MAG: formylglycine-generating enzyme family protein [Bacteroidetes bacterium]|nr:formylglycine-generating enzyme family protein [Bacteroidota bacterium]